MKILKECCIILFICCLGELTHKLFHLPVPGSVIGMLLMLLCLCTGMIEVKSIENVSNFLLDNLSFFFVPAAVGLMTCLHLVSSNLFSILTIIFFSTVIVMLSTGITVQFLKRRKS